MQLRRQRGTGKKDWYVINKNRNRKAEHEWDTGEYWHLHCTTHLRIYSHRWRWFCWWENMKFTIHGPDRTQADTLPIAELCAKLSHHAPRGPTIPSRLSLFNRGRLTRGLIWWLLSCWLERRGEIPIVMASQQAFTFKDQEPGHRMLYQNDSEILK